MLTDSFVTRNILADIRWLLTTPSLMSLPQDMDGVHLLKEMSALEDTSVESTEWSKSIQRRLGYYYEDLFNSVLERTAYISDIKRNIQVKDTNRTVGEFDFIVQTPQGNTLHIECAVKFYLCTHDGSELSHFEGPNRKDRLDLKWDKLLYKQIRLSKTDAGRAKIQALNLETPQTAVLIQGYLFYPLGQPTTTLHASINPNHLRGWWVRNEHRTQILDDQLRYQILNKPFWLARPAIPEAELFTSDQLNEELNEQHHPQLIVRLTKNDEGWCELDRGFVVQNGW
ncbi:DUF1853 family protein [Pontibacterium sp.]|uniref:DUF1853 family protein n=1 Tax=Pontibacterium sp. TaxID=2036026 RepID=UPI003518FCCA